MSMEDGSRVRGMIETVTVAPMTMTFYRELLVGEGEKTYGNVNEHDAVLNFQPQPNEYEDNGRVSVRGSTEIALHQHANESIAQLLEYKIVSQCRSLLRTK